MLMISWYSYATPTRRRQADFFRQYSLYHLISRDDIYRDYFVVTYPYIKLQTARSNNISRKAFTLLKVDEHITSCLIMPPITVIFNDTAMYEAMRTQHELALIEAFRRE